MGFLVPYVGAQIALCEVRFSGYLLVGDDLVGSREINAMALIDIVRIG